MKFILHLVRFYPFSMVCIAIIWILCFMTVPSSPLDDVAFIDKWTHIVMYAGTCSVIWIEYLRKHDMINRRRLFILAWAAPVMMSGIIELLQAYCTGGRRSGDWIDFVANTAGATLALCAGILWVSFRAKR